MNPRPSLFQIFATFLRIGVTAYGGPAMLPLLRKWLVERKRWLTPEAFKLGLAVCQSIPGGTLMQLTAYTGLKLRGLPGALAGYVGFGLPSAALITGLAALYYRYQGVGLTKSAMGGISAVVLAIIFLAVHDFWKNFAQGARQLGIALAAAGLFLAGLGPVWILLGAACAGYWLFPGATRATPELDSPKTPWAGLAVLAALSLAWLGWSYFNDSLLFDLSLSMAKVDLLSFGGYGAFPAMYHEVVESHAWMSPESFMDGMALSQVTPGPVLLGSAFMGYHLRGLIGALTGSIWVFTPSFFILMAVAPHSSGLLGAAGFRRALTGVLSTLGGMLLAVGLTLGYSTDWSLGKAALSAVSLLVLARGVDPLWVVLAGAGLGAAFL